MRKYLILEHDQTYIEQNYETCRTDAEGSEKAFQVVYVSSVEQARITLAEQHFNGAILDLRLPHAEQAEGNEVAKQIHRDYFMPIAIVTGFADELDPKMAAMAKDNNTFLRLFNKNGSMYDVFAFLLGIEQSGVLEIFGPGGVMTEMLSEIFWNHLGSVIKRWNGEVMDIQNKKRVLRHAVSHMFGALQSKENGTWDTFLPNEVYIWPAICAQEMPGHIYEESDKQGLKQYFLLVTPFCDLAKMKQRHFIQILPFSDFTTGQFPNLMEKKDHRRHVLPPTSFFDGGVIDFATLTTIAPDQMSQRLVRVGSVIEPYWREIVNRLGAWLGRQGTPNFEKDSLLDAIKAQVELKKAEQEKAQKEKEAQLALAKKAIEAVAPMISATPLEA